MPKWKPAPPELVRLFRDALAGFPEAEERKMFGYPAAFVNGNMMGGLFQDAMMLRFSPDDLEALRKQSGAKPFEPMPGRMMREYLMVPERVLESAPKLRRWMDQAFAYTRSLPAKSARAKKRAAPRASAARKKGTKS